MAYYITDPVLGATPIGAIDDAVNPAHPLGTIVQAKDPIYGSGEFIYLMGVASTVRGSLVVWDGASTGTPTYQTTLCPSTANLAQPVAVAMGPSLATKAAWYQISGAAVMLTNGTLAAGPGPIYIGSAGNVTSTAASGKQILGARNDTATGTPGTNLAVVQINRPNAQGAIT